MTNRQPSSKSTRTGMRDRLRRKRRENRQSLLQSLESRQLLAGPDLVGIQPNEGELLREDDSTVLTVSPRELTFQFDDATQIDADTLSAIRITRAGEDNVFESASATSDLRTNGAVLFEFRAREQGTVGNGITVNVDVNRSALSNNAVATVSGRSVTISVSNLTGRQSRAQDIVNAVTSNPDANALIEVIQVSGSSLASVGSSFANTDSVNLTLQGANSAQAVTDFGSGGQVSVRLVSQLPGADGRGTQVTIEQRNFGGPANPVVVTTDTTIRVQLNSAPGNETTAAEFIAAINDNPDAAAVLTASFEQGNIETAIGGITPTYSPLTLGGVSDVVVEPGYVGLGDSSREVVFRFNEPLPDDTYQIDILGSGPLALTNIESEAFNDGSDLTRRFSINLGPKVAAVVPEPVRRNADGTLSPDIGKIEVHFNDDDLNVSLAQNPSFYQLIFTKDTVNNTDDTTVLPSSVVYNSATNIATLDFGAPLSRLPDTANPGSVLQGAARLRVGTGEGLPTPPTEINLISGGNTLIDAADNFAGAFDLNSQWTIGNNATQSAVLSSEIFNTTPYELTLPGPDVAGVREIRAEDPTRLLRTVPLDHLRGGADIVDGISVIQYNFAPNWLGDDPSRPGITADTTYFSVISEQQKQRVREVVQLYSEYLGVSFVEVEGAPTSPAFFSIAVGDLYGGDERATSGDGGLAVVTRDTNGDGFDDLAVLDLQDFDESIDDQFGGEFFRGSMFAVGQLMGYGYADDLAQPVTQSTAFIFAPGTDTEASFPSVADIVHGQYLYRPDSTDIDMYKFTVSEPGQLSLETVAERLGSASLLDTTLRLYRQDANGAFVEVAQNDDYFSNDSLIDVEVEAGTYFVGVSATGNDDYNPAISGTGFGGLTEGEYELRIDFRASTVPVIRDNSSTIVDGLPGVPLDGDADGRPGGIFDFWFVPSDPNNTLYVDKAASGAANGLQGTIGNPYREIDQAIASAAPGDTIRVIGNGGVDGRVETAQDNYSYQVGFDSNSFPLQDGSTLDVPQGVRLVIDSGAVIKLSRARIGVGSTSPNVDVSDSALQVLGTPSIIGANGLPARDASNNVIPGSVVFTSINDTSVGTGNSAPLTGQVKAGDWGGIDFRGDLDSADESRRNREDEGVFLNHIQYADMRYAGGAVSVGGRQTVVSAIDMAVTRPTIINSEISLSADAAIAASPASFTETRYTTPEFQAAGRFTPDYTRVGPNIYGNTVVDNSINGLFIRVVTRSGDVIQTISEAARFDDTDITHVLTENLVIEGTAGGPILISSAPSSLLVRSAFTAAGSVPAGTYTYRVTNVSGAGLESAASQQTIPANLIATGGIQLSGLPTVGAGSDFVARNLYRATINPVTGLPGEFLLVGSLNASSTTFVDRAATGTRPLSSDGATLQSRLDASLKIDAGTILKIDGARIEARFGANLIAEGNSSTPIVFTSLEDQRYGTGGTFDTNNRGGAGEVTPGDWGGLYIGHGSSASLDHAVVAGAGGTTRIEGGFASFNALEVHQANLRLANSRFEFNADGRGSTNDTRVGRGDNASGTVFILASTPIIVNNEFVNGEGAPLSVDLNSLSHDEVSDPGRASGLIDAVDIVGNSGPLLDGNVLSGNTINGLHVRGGELTTNGVWDDVDIVHVVTDMIEIPNQHIFGGLRLNSDARGSLVVKFESQDDAAAGVVVGGSLATASDEFTDIADRIGGALQLVGHPDFPVILTTLADDSVGAGFDLNGGPQIDTNNDGIIAGILPSNVEDDVVVTTGPTFVVLPTGPEVNRGTTIDNDVDINTPGYFEASITDGNIVGFGGSGVTVQSSATNQLLIDQDFVFAYNTYVITNGAVAQLAATNITQAATLIADDVVESRGTFTGPNGLVNWVATSSFRDGVATLFSSLQMTSAAGGALGDIRVVSYLDEDVQAVSDDVLYTVGTPGEADFRAFTIDGPQRIGFSHGGYYTDDGVNQINATYTGWAADQFNELETAVAAGTATFSLPGVIDLVDLPAAPDVTFGTVYGPNDVTTAFAWDVAASESTSTVTSFLELISRAPGESNVFAQIPTGRWDGVTVREGASDRNVALVTESEPVRSSVFDTNAIPSQSQFLGEIAPNEQSGDENRRLGFVVEGAISTASDLDVYSFVAASGTEVWLDIDRTSNSLDTVVELIDANGRVLAASNDSILAETDGAALYTASDVDNDAAQPLSVVAERIQAQRLTISESIVDATSGSLDLTVDAGLNVGVPVDVFLANPALAIESALEANFPEIGDVSVSLAPRTDRVTDSVNPNVITRLGTDFVIEVRFDSATFVGRQAPLIGIGTAGVIGAAVTASVDQVLFDSQLQDTYSTNTKDAGMRIRLPGESGTRNLYHVRVRSSNTSNPLDFASIVNGDVRGGLTVGSYQLQVRLQEVDEVPGTQVKLTDIRYATTGLQIIGQPLHSPLIGEDYETSAANDTLANAQPLGYFGIGEDGTARETGPLQSDQLAKSFAGELSSATDVDWFRFEVKYENVTRDETALYLSTVFDLDYADNFARSDMALYVFDETGRLILVGGNSNIADDLPGNTQNNDTSDLSRGSAGTNDPYIGAAELSEGSYFVAVSNQQRVPQSYDQFYSATATNPLFRLEPIDSVTRIAEERFNGDTSGTASTPVVPVLFDNNSIVEHTLDDVLIYVNTTNSLSIVNPNTGFNYGNLGNFGAERVNDIAFTANGELFGFTQFGPRAAGDVNWSYRQIDTGTAGLGAAISAGAGLVTNHDDDAPIDADFVLDDVSNDGLTVEAITIREFGNVETGFFVANRNQIFRPGISYNTNILYAFDETSGLATGPLNTLPEFAPGAGTSQYEVGQIGTAVSPNPISRQLGIRDATEINQAGVAVPVLFDGDTFTLSNGVESVTFELDAGPTLQADTGQAVRDGDLVTVDGVLFEFNTGSRLQIDAPSPGGTLDSGSTVTVTGEGGQTATFQFVRSVAPTPGNIGVSMVDANGQSLTAAQLATNLALAINLSVVNSSAVATGNEIIFTGTEEMTLATVGNGVNVLGNPGVTTAGANQVDVPTTASPDLIISRLADAVRNAGIAVSSSGIQVTFPNSSVVAITQGNSLSLSGSEGVSAGNVPILLLPTDTVDVIAEKIVVAVQAAVDSNDLPNVSAIANGRSLQIGDTGFITAVTGGFVSGGVTLGGSVRGVEILGNDLYAVTNQGELYRVSGAELGAAGDRQVGTYVSRATDLIGLNFSGLRAGPASVQDGALRNILFGITFNGDIYAFNTNGELQPVFAGGRSSISTGVFGAQGFDFSTVDYNLWHVTGTRGNDAGHGVTELENGSRRAQAGGNSLAFSYEDFAFRGNYESTAERPVILNNDGTIANPRLDGTTIEDSYNLPGGAKGVVLSNTFSLEGYASQDEPVLYFNYFLNTDGVDDDTTTTTRLREDQDALRVYVIAPDGTSHLVATNNQARGLGTTDDEFDDPAEVGAYADNIDLDVAQLFDNTNSWRQARVDLGAFAGMEGLSLRVEFSTGGTTQTGSPVIRATAGDRLTEGQQLVISGETFEIDLAAGVSVPSGRELQLEYVDAAAVAVVTIDGQDYVLNDGVRAVNSGQISVNLLANSPAGATLDSLTANDIALSLAEAIRLSPPVFPLVQNVNFSDPFDDPLIADGRNDLIYEASVLPYNGGNATLEGSGRLGNFDENGNLVFADDVDLVRLDVAAGTTITIDVDLDFNATLDPTIRFFDATGMEVATTVDLVNDTVSYTSATRGAVYIGISGRGNDVYDPRQPGTARAGQVDTYTARVDVSVPVTVLTDGNLLELNGLNSVAATPAGLFSTSGQDPIRGVAVPVSRFMTSEEVAGSLQQSLADRFYGGNLAAVPVAGSAVNVAGLTVDDSGPFANEGDRYGDRFGAGVLAGAGANTSEGVYLDDFVIGFAERGEIASNSNVVNGPFIANGLASVPVPNDPVSNLQTGSYQVEIRDASEYVASGQIGTSVPAVAIDAAGAPVVTVINGVNFGTIAGTTTLVELDGDLNVIPIPGPSEGRFRTFDTNDRLTDARSLTASSGDLIRDGQTFSIFDGRSTVTFEFDLEESATGVTPGNVRVPYTLQYEEPGSEDIDLVTGQPLPGTGTIRANSAHEVAANIIAAINRSDVQAIIDVPALPSSGINSINSPRVDLFGEVVVLNDDGALASVDRADVRGDDNRDRSGQGVILIENSRFLYNELYGIEISHDATATVDGVETSSVVRYPRNLVELNTESIVPGVVVQSNVIAHNQTGGIQVAGLDPALLESGSDPIPYERIINNTIIGGSVIDGVETPAEQFQGVLFPSGAVSFADAIVSYVPDAGGSAPTVEHQDASTALGAPDCNGRGPEPANGDLTVSLGLGGSLTVQFTNNLLTGSGDSQPDLVVFETGAVESVRVEISRDGVNFFDVGIIGGLTNQLDIDAAGFGVQDQFSFVRLTDLRQGSSSGNPLGADIDAIGALSSTTLEQFTSGGTGINIVGNAAPALLNNIIANSTDGIVVNATNSLTILGGNTYYRNDLDVPTGVSRGQFAQVLPDAEVVFIDASRLVFGPAAGSSVIDSSIDSLEDRSSLTTVKSPLGLPPSPIVAPQFDVNGQLRVDDPGVETPSGVGERVFKDRGAYDRGDQVGPRVVLLSPQAPNLGTGAGVVNVYGDAPTFFEFQFLDGLAPADVVPGTGIDDQSITSGSVLLFKDNVALVEGVDYRFGYNPSTNTVRLTPIAGVWEENSVYVIRMVDASDAIISASAGTAYVDGTQLNVIDSTGATTSFEYETGLMLTLTNGLTLNDAADGVTFELFDGQQTRIYEFDNDSVFDSSRIRVPIEQNVSATDLATALAAAVNDSVGFQLTAYASADRVQFLGGTPLSTATSSSSLVTIAGAIGTSVGFGLQLPTNGAALGDTIVDGQVFTIFRGSVNQATFEFSSDGSVDTVGAIPVSFNANSSLDSLANELVRAIGGTTLGLIPVNEGFGRISLGGDSNYSVDLGTSGLTQIAVPGQESTVPVIVRVDQTAEEVAAQIAQTLAAAGLAGVQADVVDRRVFLEGTGGISGVGASNLTVVRDEVGNFLQSNQTNGRTELTVFIGNGLDYGDAPAPYSSLLAANGARHAVNPEFALYVGNAANPVTVTPDSDAQLNNNDADNGVVFVDPLQVGFNANVQVGVVNTDGRAFYLDAWFDWDQDGVFEDTEVQRFGSIGTGRSIVGVGTSNISVQVPSDAALGNTYARFRLSESSNLSSLGAAASGEVEDFQIVVTNNPFQNTGVGGSRDVNASGVVTPLDALHVINLLQRAMTLGNVGSSVDLSVPQDASLFTYAVYPDATGDGFVSVRDALVIINQLSDEASNFNSEGESVADTYTAVSNGLLASSATAVGDELISQAVSAQSAAESTAAVESVHDKISVFDSAAVIELDSLVDTLAEDRESSTSDEETSAVDQLFSQM